MSDDEDALVQRAGGFLAADVGNEGLASQRAAGTRKRKRPTQDAPDGADEHEAVPRLSHPEWARGVAGRLPLKLSDGRLQAAGARPAQPPRRGGGAEDEAGAALNDDGRGRREDEDEEEAEEEAEGGGGSGDEKEDEEEEEAARRAAAHARRDVTSFRELRALPPSKAAARRSEKKVAVAELSQRIIADPEHSVSASSTRALASAASRAGTASGDEDKLKRNHMLALHGLCADADPAIRRLAMLSLTTVFKDILPGYRIRLPTAAEAATKAKKDVKRLRDYESCLLTGYQRFLRLLEHTVSMGEGARRGMLLRAQKRGGRSEEEEEVGGKGGAGAFEVDNGAEKDVWADEEEGEGGGKGKAKKGGVGTRDFVAAKMEAKKAAKAARDGMAPYDGDDESKIALGRAALSCLGALLSGMPHFNFRSNIAAFLVPRMSSKDEEAADIACGAAAAAFVNDRSFECALEITRVLSDEAKMSTSRHGKPRLREKALQVLLKLPLGDLEKLDALDRDAKVNQGELKRAAKAARKARQQGKPQEGQLKVGSAGEVADEDADAMADIVAGLRAADAENSTERKKYAQAVLKRVITIYFRILRTPSHGGLLPVAMAGLARFAHLIDVSVVGDLLAALRDTLSSCGVAGPAEEGEEGAGGGGGREPTLSLSSALSTILTALRIMAGPGGVLNADEGTFAKFLFSSLLRVAGPGGAEHATIALYSLQALLINRREYSPDRVTAFVKRVLTLCLALPVPITLALLSTVRTILHRYSHVRSMMAAGGGGTGGAAGGGGAVRTDTTLGIASGEPGACHNPDRTGAALSTMGWELAVLVNHWHPAVRTAAAACAGCLPVAPSEAPTALLQAHDENSGLFVPPVPLPPTRGAFKYPRGAAREEEAAGTAGGSVPEPVRRALLALAGAKTRRLREKADLVLARSVAAAASLAPGDTGGTGGTGGGVRPKVEVGTGAKKARMGK